MVGANEVVRILDEITESIANRWQNDDGGWSAEAPVTDRSRKKESDVWTTAQCLLWLMEYGAANHEPKVLRGLEYLSFAQHLDANVADRPADGGWGWKVDDESEVTGTSLSLLAFIRHRKTSASNRPGSGHDNYLMNMRHSRDWLLKHVNADGGYSLKSQPHSSAYGTCWACLALKECLDIDSLGDPRIRGAIVPDALELVEATRKSNGWGSVLSHAPDALGTAYCCYLLLQMKQRNQASVANGLNWLRRNQLDNGSWEPRPTESPVEATAWATIALLAGDTEPSSPRIQSALGYLLGLYRPALGWPAERGGEVLMWATYYACLALSAYAKALRMSNVPTSQIPGSTRGRKVFIVHGHNIDIRNQAEHLIESIGFEAVVLDKKPNHGLTLMEKFEYYANPAGVDYAVVLCTPDDMDVTEGAMIPRGNVLVELGWFAAKLGRNRVTVACDGPVRLPTDLSGIVTINLRNPDWREKIKEDLQDTRDV